MMPLHKKYNQGMIKRYSIYTIVLFLLSCLFLSIKQYENSLLQNLSTAWSIFSLPASLIFFFTYTHFIQNIDSLINQNHNRFTLLKFYICSQLIKTFFFILNFLLILLSSRILNKLFSISITDFKLEFFLLLLKDFNTSYVSIFYYYFFLSLAFIGIIQAGICTIMEKKPNKTKFKLKNTFFKVMALITFLYIITYYSVPYIPTPIAYSLGVWLCMLGNFLSLNTVFKLVPTKKQNNTAFKLTTPLVMPLLIITFLIKCEITNENLPYKERSAAVAFLDYVPANLSKTDKYNMLKASTDIDNQELLKLFSNDLNKLTILNNINNPSHAINFMSFYKKTKFNESEIIQIINFMSNLKSKNELDHQFAADTQFFFKSKKVSQKMINQLIKSTDSYKKLAALHLAYNSLPKKEYIDFYNKHRIDLGLEITTNQSIKEKL